MASNSQAVEREKQLKETERLYLNLRQVLARQPGPEIKEELGKTRKALQFRGTKMKVTKLNLTDKFTELFDKLVFGKNISDKLVYRKRVYRLSETSLSEMSLSETIFIGNEFRTILSETSLSERFYRKRVFRTLVYRKRVQNDFSERNVNAT